MYARSSCSSCGQRVWASPDSAARTCSRCKMGLNSGLEECGICLGPVFDSLRYVKVGNESWGSQGCSHSGSFCRVCLQQYLRSQLSEGCWNIRCPSVRCQYLLLEADVDRILQGATSDQAGAPDQAERKMLLARYKDLRNADYGAHLRAVLRKFEKASGTAATASAAVAVAPAASDNEAKVARAVPASLEDHAAFAASSSDSSEDQPASLAHAASPTLDGNRDLPTLSAADEESFGAWAMQSCQACPRCFVIIRKETGCDSIQCRCGASFCYGCGAIDDYPKKRECLCTSHTGSSPVLGRWLRSSGMMDANKSTM